MSNSAAENAVPTRNEAPSTGGLELGEKNRRFYGALWSSARVIGPERFNTWPLVCNLVAQDQKRLEVAPGLRPRLPIDGTRFVDQSAAAVSKLRSHGASAVRGLVTCIPFADDTFDLVCALDIVEHVVDDESALSELSRVAAPDATLLLSVPLHESRWTAFDDHVGHHRRYEPEPLRKRLSAHGFSVVASAIYGMKPRSSRLVDLGMWFLEHRREKAVWWYDRVFLPLRLRLQSELAFERGMTDGEGVDEILIVCRKYDAHGRNSRAAWPHGLVDRLIQSKGEEMNMKKALTMGAMLMGLVTGTGCMIVDAPVMGVLGSRVRWGDFAQGDDKSSKEGKACMDTVLGLVARGDASVRAAKAAGGITEVAVVDHSARNFLNIVGEYCTIVRGN